MSSSDSRLVQGTPTSGARLSLARRAPHSSVSPPVGASEELGIAIEWIEQAVEGLPDSWGRARLQGWTHGLRDLQERIARVMGHASDLRFARLFAPDGAAANFLAQLLAWCQEISRQFDELATKLRRGQPALAVFPFKVVSDSYVRFQRLETVVRASIAGLRPAAYAAEAPWHRFDADFEELVWSTEWLHMSLAVIG